LGWKPIYIKIILSETTESNQDESEEEGKDKGLSRVTHIFALIWV
jgi:hypothetical protein